MAPAVGKVVDYALEQAFEEDGDIVWLRFEEPINSSRRTRFEQEAFGGLIEYAAAMYVAQDAFIQCNLDFLEAREAQREALEARVKAEFLRERAEKERAEKAEREKKRREYQRKEHERKQSLARFKKEEKRREWFLAIRNYGILAAVALFLWLNR